jgi:ligand-binding sensor protein
MLKDGRITGIRVGGQWRFSPENISGLIAAVPTTTENVAPLSSDVLPLHCVQSIQQVFAEIAQVGSLTTSATGEPLTAISNSCKFCDLIIESEGGRRACIASWRKLASQSDKRPNFVKCHAGLDYARARIEVEGQLVAMVIAGQFYVAPPEPSKEKERVNGLAESFGIDANALAEAAKEIHILDDRHVGQLAGWLQRVADTFEEVARERAGLMNRLRNIATISTLPNQ